MNTLIRWLYRAALSLGLVLVPPLVYAAYIFFQEDDGAAALRNTLSNTQVLWLGRNNELEKLDAARVHIWELDRREYIIYIADIGTPASHYFVMPTTGVIERASCVNDASAGAGTITLTGADTVIRLYSSGIRAYDWTTYTGAGATALYLDSRVTDFLITMTQNGYPGTRYADEAVNQTVNQDDVIAVETDGGTTNTMVGRCSLWVRARH